MKEKVYKHRGKTHILGRRFWGLDGKELRVDLVAEVRSRLQVRIQREGEHIDLREIRSRARKGSGPTRYC